MLQPTSILENVGNKENKQQKTIRRLLASLLSNKGHRPECLRLLATQPRGLVINAIEAEFETMLSRIWARGWLPGEILRQIRRFNSPAHEELLKRSIASHHQKLDPASLHPRWLEHLANLNLRHVLDQGWMWNLSQNSSWIDFLALAVDTLVAGSHEILLETVIPPPGTELTTESLIKDRIPSANPHLETVRNLLAKAESTEFDAEAESLTAKAQQLMAKHSLDEALVWSRSGSRTEPTIIRIAIDEPYVSAKKYLVHVVAEGSRCRSVFHPLIAMSSIVGFEVDVYATETLFTSLLLQAQSSMQRASKAAPPGSRSRSRGFRSSFLFGYATRISERLNEINAHLSSDSSVGGELLPVLASRSSAVDEATDRWFTNVTTSSSRAGTDIHGHLAGQQAADLAKLSNPLVA